MEVLFAEWNLALLQNNTLPFAHLQCTTPPLPLLNEQMTSNSAFTKRNIQKPTLILGAVKENLLFFFCHMELLSLINCKSRNSSSDSSSNLPEFKRRKEKQELEDLQEVLDILMILEDAEAEQSDVVLTALHMAQNLTKLDGITLQIKLLQNSVNKINATVSTLENEVAQIKNDLKTAFREINELKNSVSSLNKDVEGGKSSLEVLRKKAEEDHRKLELQFFNYEIYQCWENFRFYGICE